MMKSNCLYKSIAAIVLFCCLALAGLCLRQLLDANQTVFQAHLDLCDAKSDRIKAIEQSIKETEPL
jgi:hypothetical protein